MSALILKRQAGDFLLRGHPWVFSGAVAAVEGDPAPGETVEVLASDRSFLARAAFSPSSQIRARVWTFDEGELVDEAFFARRIAAAVSARGALAANPEGACRLVFAESDGLPGVIVDRYADRLVAQFLSAGAERWKEAIVAALAAAVPCRGVYERSDTPSRAKEGLAAAAGPLRGDPPEGPVTIREGDARFLVDIVAGHKTGFYLDQRENRALFREHAAGADVLNAFCYTGAFTVAALRGGARHVTAVDSSASALALARRNAELNGFAPDAVDHVEGDAFRVLRTFRDSRRSFDAIVLDPPKLAQGRADLPSAARAYKDINLMAFKLLRPGGRLFTFSCSEQMDAALFQKVVADAALDAGRHAHVFSWLSQSPDHPVALAFPEGRYLKGLACRVQGDARSLPANRAGRRSSPASVADGARAEKNTRQTAAASRPPRLPRVAGP
jgi:23S rRNA (cytosine1962-C5)-methyltransferase